MTAFRRARSDQDVWQLVAYLRSLSGGPRVEVPGDPAKGERLYRNKGGCTSCHMIDGAGGLSGPDLSTIGARRSPEDLLSDLVEPDERVMPRWWRMRVVHRDGTPVAGR
ncbi:MAG TPA: c-type cytochrome, partial [Gemmatimonadetes bacterium]|nr:c-type cytochrome [Gemmatimonadota bacterium]